MRLLVLGGTRFVGRAIVDEAVSRGHDVTTFTRGVSGNPRPGAEALHGDRTVAGDLRQLADRAAAGSQWDAVIDTSVLAPVHVQALARLLAPHVGHYTYISTISVYEEQPEDITTEDSPVLECPPGAEGTMESLGYGELKAGSERAVLESFPDRNLLVRPGVIVGPHENMGRICWWLLRFARGGTILAPGSPSQRLRLTDARDLASWVVDNTRRGIPGTVNMPGALATLGDLLASCAQATRSDGEIRWVPDETLLAAGVEPWMQLPLWAPPAAGMEHIWEVSGDRALRTGLRYRPLADTVRDTWAWLRQQAAAAGTPVSEFPIPEGVGLDPDLERDILAGL